MIIGTHHLLGPESNRKRIEAGVHNFQVKGMVTALNIETGEAHRITKELFYSRRDIYFHNASKVFQEWKRNRLEEPGMEKKQVRGVSKT